MNSIINSNSMKINDYATQTIDSLRSVDKIEESQDIKDINFKQDVNRILTILDTCIEKTKLAFCLPEIIEQNPKLIESKSNKLEAVQIISSFKTLVDILQPVMLFKISLN